MLSYKDAVEEAVKFIDRLKLNGSDSRLRGMIQQQLLENVEVVQKAAEARAKANAKAEKARSKPEKK